MWTIAVPGFFVSGALAIGECSAEFAARHQFGADRRAVRA